MDSLLDFSNKVILITGAGSGFGRLLAEGLGSRGAKPVSYTHLTLPTNREV